MRSILLTFALVLVLPANALAAGTLTVSISGAGGVSGSGIECTRAPIVNTTGTCSVELTEAATLTAAPAAGFVFGGWSGACTGTSGSCAVGSVGGAVGATFRDVEDPVVSLVSPVAGAVKGPMTIAAGVTDNGVIEKVQFKVGSLPSWADTEAPYGAVVPTAPFPDGLVPITATAYDKAGNSHTATVEVRFDNTAPVVHAVGPDREAFAPGSTQTWTVSASDAGSGIAATACSVVPNGAPRVIVPCSGGGSHTVSGLPEGRYEFAFGAKDAAGNYAETVRFFRIENPVTGSVDETADADFGGAPASDGAQVSSKGAASAVASASSFAAPPKIAVALGFRFASLSRATKLSNFVVRGVPSGATVTVSCLKGCDKKSLKRFVRRGGRISLRALARSPLKVDTTITVIVSKPGHTSAVKVLEIRARMAPLVTTQCQPEGASKPVDC